MAVRIYSLAKELKVDSKELVDICTKAGVPGKGSALASLTEEEVEKVKQFLKGGGTAKAKPREGCARCAAAPDRASARRQDAGDRYGEAGCADLRAEPAKPSRTEPEPVEPVEDADRRLQPSRRETAVAVEHFASPWPAGRRDGREKYIGPGTMSGKVPVVGAESRGGDRKKTGRRLRRASTAGR